MSQLRKCDICGHMIENKSDLPDRWTNLSIASINGDRMNFGQIDICNACRSEIAEFYDDLSSGTLTVNNDYYARLAITNKVLRFILGLDNREKS